MKKYVFLTCDDLSEFVVDDDYAFKAFEKLMPNSTYDVVSWSSKNIDWSIYDFAVIRTTWDYTKNIEVFLEALKKNEKAGCKILNPCSVVEWNAKKTYLQDLESKGVEIIKSIFLDSEDEKSLKEKLESFECEKFVIKPVVGASADQIKILKLSEVGEHVKNLKNPSEWFIQPFIEEVLKGEISYFFFGGEYSHAVKKVPKVGDFRVQEEHGGEITSYNASSKEIGNAKNIVDSLEEKLLYARVDVLKTMTGDKLIELELIEPSLYFRIDPKSADRYIKTLRSWS